MMMRSKVSVEVVRSDGKTFLFGDVWGIKALSGLDTPDTTLYTEKKANGEGVEVTGQYIDKRVISVSATSRLRTETLRQMQRAEAVAFFNPRYTYRLTVTYQGTTRWIDGRLDAFKLPSGNIYAPLKLDAEFLCPDPYLHGMDDFAQNIAAVTPMFGFPCMLPAGGVPVSAYNFARSVAVLNDGDVPCGFRAALFARGEVVNPKIIKGDRYVRLLTTLHEGDVAEIDITAKTITINGQDALHLIDRTSGFTDMAFEVGDNTIGYDADSGNNLLDVTLYYTLNYIGM